MSERLWFSHTVEGLFLRGLGARLTPALRQRVKDEGIDLDKLLPAYPIERVMAACRAVAPTLYPQASEAEAFFALGRTFLEGYGSTFLGAALMQVMRVVGPRRSLERMQKNFRTGTNFIETRFHSPSPGVAELWFNDVHGMPDFYRGILEAGGHVVGAEGMTVTVVDTTPPSATFRVVWKE